MAIREGRWDCPSCGSRGVYGRHVDCPGCGKPRPAGVRFYLTDDAPVITNAAQLAEAKAGADWICAHCGATSRATLSDCGGCGAARGSSPTQRVIDYAADAVPRDGEGHTSAPAPEQDAGPTGWNCAHCDTTNRAALEFCGSCTRKRGTVPVAEAAAHAAQIADLRPSAGEPELRPSAEHAGVVGTRHPFAWKKSGIGLGAVAAAVILAVAVLNGIDDGRETYPSDYLAAMPVAETRWEPGVITGMRWEREVAVEQRLVESGEGWTPPDSAQLLGRERRVTRYDQVLDGYDYEEREVPRTRTHTDYVTRTRQVSERVQTGSRSYVCGQRDLGNGYFEDRYCEEPRYETRYRTETYQEPVTRSETVYETRTERVPRYRQEPVYATWYRWRAPRWAEARRDSARGDTTAPAWPAPALRRDQRLGMRGERYYITFQQPGQAPVELAVAAHQWEQHRVGQRLALRFDGYGGVPMMMHADSLPQCREWHRGAAAVPPDSLGCTPLPTAEAPDSAAPPADSAATDTTAAT